MCVGGSHLNLKILRMVQYFSPPPSLFNKGTGALLHPLSSSLIQHTSRVHTTWHIQCIMYWTGVLNWTGICTGLVFCTGMASPVHTTHQFNTYNTSVQYIQHTSPVHTTHQSSAYNTPVQHIDGWISSKMKNGVAKSPEYRKDVFSLKDMWV